MKRNKKLMLTAIAAMGVVAMGVGGAGTFAWYQATAAAGITSGLTNTDNLTVSGTGQSLNGVHFLVAPEGTIGTDYANSLIITNRTGRSYQRSGDVYTELYGSDSGSTLWAKTTNEVAKQSRVQFRVKIVDAIDNAAAAATNALASIADTYYVKVKASGSVKISDAQTTSLGNKETAAPAVAFANPSTGGSIASGALGAAEDAEFDVMKIVVDGNGSVTYSVKTFGDHDHDGSTANAWYWPTATSFGTLTDGQLGCYVYYGLEVQNSAAQSSHDLQSNSCIKVAGVSTTPQATLPNESTAG